MNEFQAAAELARDLVLKAGRLVVSLKGNVDVRDKGGELGPVTEADLAAEKILLDGIRAAYPDDAILSEESHSAIDGPARRIWCVDPLDGTREYVKGLNEYAVQAGLLVDGKPVAGAFAVPEENLVFWGWQGGGAFVNEERIEIAPKTTLADAVAIHSRSRSEGIREVLEKLGIERSFAVGGCGYKVSRVLLSEADVYVHALGGTTWWDTVGPAAVIFAAGGYVGDTHGEPLDYDGDVNHRHGLVFAAPGLRPQLTERLR